MGSIIRYEPSVSVSAPKVNTSSGLGEGLVALAQGIGRGVNELETTARFMTTQENKTKQLHLDSASKQYAAKFMGESEAFKEQTRQEALVDTQGLSYTEKMNEHFDALPDNIRERIRRDHPADADILESMTMQEMGAWLKDARKQIPLENTKVAIAHFNRNLGQRYEEANRIAQSGHPGDIRGALDHLDQYLAQGEALMATDNQKRTEHLSKYGQALVERLYDEDLIVNPELAMSNFQERRAAISAYVDAPTARALAQFGAKGQKESQALREDLAASWFGQQKALGDDVIEAGAKAFGLTKFHAKEIAMKSTQLERDIVDKAWKFKDEQEKRASEALAQTLKGKWAKTFLSGDYKGNAAKAYKEALREYGDIARNVHADHQTPLLAFLKSLADAKSTTVPNPEAYASLSRVVATNYNSPTVETHIIRADIPDADKEKLIDKLNTFRQEFVKEHKATVAKHIQEQVALHAKDVHKYGPRGVESEIELSARLNDALLFGDKSSATPQQKQDYLELQKNPTKHMQKLMSEARERAEFAHLEDGRMFIEREERETGQPHRSLSKLSTISSMRVVTPQQQHEFQAATDYLNKVDPTRELNTRKRELDKQKADAEAKQKKFEDEVNKRR